MKRVPVTAVSFIAGIISAIPIVFPKMFLIGLVSFALPAYIEYTASGRQLRLGRTYLRGLSYFMGFGIMLFSWFRALYPLEFTGLSKAGAVAVVIAGWFGLSLLQASVWAFVFHLNGIIARIRDTRSSPMCFSLVFTCLYVIFEWITTKTWAAVPWGRLAVGQTEFLPMIQISSVLGGYGVTFILVFFGCAIGCGIAEFRNSRNQRSFNALALAAAFLAANLTFGLIRTVTYDVPDESTKITVAAIQGNISSHEKWDEDSFGYIKDQYTALTKAAAEDGAELIVFPETPFIYNLDGSNGYIVRSYLKNLASKTNATIVTGVFTRTPEGISENSVVAVSPDDGILPQKYVKRHLVPFGEYVPMRDLISVIFPPLSDISMLSDDLAEGTDPVVIDTEYGTVAPLICFDSIYETLAIDSVRAGGELITLSTNDSWFLDSPAVWEHNKHAVLRSVECGRYTVRAANTGVSSIISPIGEIMESLPALEDGYITTDVYMIEDKTVYATVGNVFIPACLICLILTSFYCGKKAGKEESDV